MNKIRWRVWHGKIPIRITVSEPESIGDQEYLLIASRCSYLLTYLPHVLAYFDSCLDHSQQGEWWLEYEDEPLPFHRPIGLLYDLMVGTSTGEPWDIQLKRGEYPDSKILKFDNDETLQTYWTNQFKESCYIRDGNAHAVMRLPKEDQEALWHSITNAADLDPEVRKESGQSFWGTMLNLLKFSPYNWKVPLKFYMMSTEDDDNDEARPFIQVQGRPIQTIEEVIRGVDDSQKLVAVVHGIEVPSHTILSDLYANCTYPDGFLHIVLKAP